MPRGAAGHGRRQPERGHPRPQGARLARSSPAARGGRHHQRLRPPDHRAGASRARPGPARRRPRRAGGQLGRHARAARRVGGPAGLRPHPAAVPRRPRLLLAGPPDGRAGHRRHRRGHPPPGGLGPRPPGGRHRPASAPRRPRGVGPRAARPRRRDLAARSSPCACCSAACCAPACTCWARTSPPRATRSARSWHWPCTRRRCARHASSSPGRRPSRRASCGTCDPPRGAQIRTVLEAVTGVVTHQRGIGAVRVRQRPRQRPRRG